MMEIEVSEHNNVLVAADLVQSLFEIPNSVGLDFVIDIDDVESAASG